MHHARMRHGSMVAIKCAADAGVGCAHRMTA